ncbi:hypothetical protein AbA118F_2861 [Acinetobacter baumannii]|nr:hypothetical protein [Acinetobacter baumannii]
MKQRTGSVDEKVFGYFFKKVMELATFFGDKTVRLRRDNH